MKFKLLAFVFAALFCFSCDKDKESEPTEVEDTTPQEDTLQVQDVTGEEELIEADTQVPTDDVVPELAEEDVPTVEEVAEETTSEGCDAATLREEALTNGEQLFNGVTMDASTPIADIVTNLDDFDGQVVQIEGWVKAVCTSQGCWATLIDGKGNDLNLKVTDGVIDFRDYVTPGHYVVGEGVFNAVGEHGSQVFIQDHGAMVGTIECSLMDI